MKIYLYPIILLLLIFSIRSANTQTPIPYEPFSFENYSPKWIHAIIDTSIIGVSDTSSFGIVTVFDGWSSYSPYSNNYLIQDSFLLHFAQLTNPFFPGCYLEKINLNTGQTIWKNHFDSRGLDRKEFGYYSYLNEDGDFKILGAKQLYNEVPDPPGDLWIRASLALREYDNETGVLLSYKYGDEMDSMNTEISIPINFFKGSGTFLHPFEDDLRFTVQASTSKVTEFQSKVLDDEGHLINQNDRQFLLDTTYVLNSSKIKYATRDQLVHLQYSVKKNTKTRSDSFKLEYALLNSEFEVLESKVLTNYVNPQLEYRLESVGENFFTILGIDTIDVGNLYKYELYVFNLKGELMETIPLVDKDGSYWELGNLNAATTLEGESGMLIFSKEIAHDGVNMMKISKSDGNGNLKTIKVLRVNPENQDIIAFKVLQLANQNILIYANNSNYNLPNTSNSALVWMCFSAEDLGLITTTSKLDDEELRCSIQPNPASDHVLLQFEKPFSGIISLLDMSGRIVQNHEVENVQAYKFTLVDYIAGQYNVTIQSINGDQITKKIIIK